MNNRSVPANILLPHIVYRNVDEAAAWLNKTLGFVEHYRYGPPREPQGAQMHLGEAWVMIRGVREGASTPALLGAETQSLTIFVDDLGAHYHRTKSAGAKIVEELHVTEYGERQYGVTDLDGHHWLFAEHARDVSPEEWGATLAR
jgi:uncharacterized glyoxalase superfamily protein PhnB